ncbi:MAG: helix-turn-helix domain-containing protein, partial [Gammaproteobacteria bacterium]
ARRLSLALPIHSRRQQPVTMQTFDSISSPRSSGSIHERIRYSTADVPAKQRREWLHEVIGREYAQVEITEPSEGELFNEMNIYPWRDLRLSVIRSNPITLERLPREPYCISQDAYFAVVHLAGDYHLRQNGREASLKPGDLVLYDATLPHRIECSRPFGKLIVSIPRPLLKDRLPGVEHSTALCIPGNLDIGSIASRFIRSVASQSNRLSAETLASLSEHALDLLTMAVASVRPGAFNLSQSRASALFRVKDLIERRLADPGLTPAAIAAASGLSPRYLNALFNDENTSLMRYVLRRRLEHCKKDLLDPSQAGRRISDIAFRWGFNDSSHFSRCFKRQFGCSAQAFRSLVNL